MQKVLANVQDDRLKTYVIWMTAFARDSHGSAALQAKEWTDSRVKHFWDANNATGRGWMSTLNIPMPAWDVYFLYGADAHWDSEATYPDFFLHQAGSALPEKLHLQSKDSVERFEQKARELLASIE